MTNYSRMDMSFASPRDKRRYYICLVIFILLGLVFAIGLVFYDNPVPVTSASFTPILKRRLSSLLTMFIVAICHSLATISFQSITNNRVITPSIMGFDAVYNLIHTSIVFFLGSQSLIAFSNLGAFIIQILLMMAFCVIVYGFLFNKMQGDLHTVLLLGIVMGSAFNSLALFMRRMLSPSEFDLLQAQLLGSVNNAEVEYLPLALFLVFLVATCLFAWSSRLDVMNLGQAIAKNLGLSSQRGNIIILFLVSILMAVSTALIGSITFYGFLVASLTYQLTPTYRHRYLFAMGMVLAFVIITGAYFIMYHIYDAQGVVSIVIEFVGGLAFLAIIFRRGKL